MKAMRKFNRQMDADWALQVFDRAPFITISMITPDGLPYAVPLSIARKDAHTFYFHCAFEGEKLDCISHCPVVWLSAVSKCTPKFEEEKGNFTEYYHSAMARGKAEPVTDRTEKIEALKLICTRFLPKYMEHFDSAIERSLERTNVIRITLIAPPVGKCKGA